MKSKKIGMQALKIAIGSSLAIYIANLFGLKYSLAAGSVALLTMVTTKWKTVKLSLARVVTFIISVLMALIIFSAVESEWMAYGIYVFFVVIIAEMLGWGATISVNALIGMHFLEVRDFEFDFIANEFMLVLIGIISGLLCGLYGVGALLAAYVSRVAENSHEFKANICVVFVVENTIRIILYVATGILTLSVLKQVVILIPFMLAAVFLGMKSSSVLNEKIIKKIVIILLILSGIVLIINNIPG